MAYIENEIDLSVYPYLDRFDSTQNRTRLAFNPDKHLQNSELNEIQSIFSYYLGQLGDIIASDGDMQTGMTYSQNGNNITVASGKVYLAGKVRNFVEQTVTIKGSGLEYIGVRLVQKLITYKDDSSLNDPTTGFVGSGTDGADRIQETVELVANDAASAPIYKFNNGVLYIGNSNAMLSKVSDMMAKQNFDTFGSYRIGNNNEQSGFDLSLTKSPTDPTHKVQLNIGKGLAYVQGYAVEKPNTSQLDLRKATDTESITNEQHIYHNGTSSYNLSLSDVKSINQVTAQVQRTFPINHKAQDGTDYIVDNLISVDKVYTEGNNGLVYQAGRDYEMTGNSISWSPAAGQEPAVNSSYLATVTYNKTLTGGGVDYTATVASGVGSISSISFAGARGSGGQSAYVPKDRGYISINYDIYQYRIDTITLDKLGNFTVHEGQPNRQSVVAAPSLVDPLTLTVGTAMLYPNSDTGYCATTAVTNITFAKLNRYANRIANLEYNEIVNSLNTQAIQSQNAMNLRGVLTDNFVNMDKYDESYSNQGTGATDAFKSNVMFSMDDGRITLPRNSQDPNHLVLDVNSSVMHTFGHMVTAPFDMVTMVDQPLATGFVNINEYNLTNREGVLKITPGEDSWIDLNKVVVEKTATTSYNTGRWWNHPGKNVSGGASNAYYNSNVTWDDRANKTISRKVYDKTIHGTILSSGGQTTTDTQVQYMRAQDITFTASGLLPHADNLVMYFAGMAVPITPASGYSRGSSVEGSIASDSNGTAKGVFTIPSNIRCGTVEVALKNSNNAAVNTYTAEGINRTVTDVIMKTYVTAHLTDPIAETFSSTIDQHIPAVGLFFGSKSKTSSVTVQIRGVSNTGQPTDVVYADTSLLPSQIKVSNDASAETVVSFDKPIQISAGQQLAIVVITDSSDYTLAYAKMGSKTLDGKGVVQGNAYLQGVMGKSSNASWWTAMQDEDLKFKVYACQFNKTAQLNFNPFTNIKLDQFVLLSTYLTPANTGCIWEYRMLKDGNFGTLASMPWLPLANYTLTDANGVAKQVQLRATFTANEYISPIMSLDDLQFGAFVTALRADYVTVSVDATEAPFNQITLDYLENLPGQSAVIPQYSLNGGQTWVNFTSNPTTSTYSTDWTEVKYVQKLSSDAKNIKFHLKMTTPNPYQRPSVARFTSSWIEV